MPILTHPNDFLPKLCSPTKKEDMCFVIIPYEKKFDKVYNAIKNALNGIMECYRAKDYESSPSVFENIFDGINSAKLIVADLTGQNPNVYYELGFAHTCTKDVLLITQKLNHIGYDLRALNCEQYRMKSLDSLTGKIRRIAEKLQKTQPVLTQPVLIEGSLNRTKRIVEYMENLNADNTKNFESIIIRHAGALSSFSNPLSVVSYSESENNPLLIKERDLLIGFLKKGAKIKVIFSPLAPFIFSSKKDIREQFRERLMILRDFLVSDSAKNCEIVVSTFVRTNLFFFDKDIFFEGHSPKPGEGFAWTKVYSDRSDIENGTKIFDYDFDEFRKETIKKYGSKGDDPNNPEHLRRAAIKAIDKAIGKLDEKTSTTSEN